MQQELIQIVYKKFEEENRIELPKDMLTLSRVTEACQKVIEELEYNDEVNLNIPFIMADSNGPKHISFSVTKEMINSYYYQSHNSGEKNYSLNYASSEIKPEEEKKRKEKKKNIIKIVLLIIGIIIITITLAYFEIDISGISF